MKWFILLFLFCSCDNFIEPDGCKQNEEIENIKAEEICLDSLRCVENGVASFSNYICFCDKVCICFFSILENCNSIYDECKSTGSMLIMNKNFCLLENNREILEDLYERTKEVISK